MYGNITGCGQNWRSIPLSLVLVTSAGSFTNVETMYLGTRERLMKENPGIEKPEVRHSACNLKE